jgi:hypothetical protein
MKQTPAVFDKSGHFVGLDDATIATFDPELRSIYDDLLAAAKALERAEADVERFQIATVEATKALRAAQSHVEKKPQLTRDDLVRVDLIGDKLAMKRVAAEGKI